MPNHVHLLIEISNPDKFTHFIRNIKASSSLWIHKNISSFKDFSWQEGYGSFSVSYSSVEMVKKYIQNQESYHAKISFEEEFLKLLELHHMDNDKKYVFG